MPINEYSDLYDAAIVKNKIWVVGTNGLILHSDNNGHVSGEHKKSNTAKYLTKVKFVDENNGWVMAR